LFQLTEDLSAAVLVRMLGIRVAVAWRRACVGQWTTYAADVSRCTNSEIR
jgi:hypothetical protein